jgi:hypothetical protein
VSPVRVRAGAPVILKSYKIKLISFSLAHMNSLPITKGNGGKGLRSMAAKDPPGLFACVAYREEDLGKGFMEWRPQTSFMS